MTRRLAHRLPPETFDRAVSRLPSVSRVVFVPANRVASGATQVEASHAVTSDHGSGCS